MHSLRRPAPDPGSAQADYALAREQLLSAEAAYARALLRLQRAQVGYGEPPLAPRERHFLCGHAEMECVEEAGDQILNLCPGCRIELARPHETHFVERRLLLLREPRPDDPD